MRTVRVSMKLAVRTADPTVVRVSMRFAVRTADPTHRRGGRSDRLLLRGGRARPEKDKTTGKLVSRGQSISKYTRRDSNPQPSVPKTFGVSAQTQ